MSTGVAFTGHSQSGSVLGARRDAHLDSFGVRYPPVALEKLRKDIAESATVRLGLAGARPSATHKVGEIESAEVHAMRRGASRTRAAGRNSILRIEADLIVHLPFLGIAQHVVGVLN